jgi:hypothetical protein
MSLEPHWTVVVLILLVSALASGLLLRRSIGRACVECGHARSIHRDDGRSCDGLIGDWARCGCESFVPAAPPPRSVPRREPPRADRQIRKAS